MKRIKDLINEHTNNMIIHNVFSYKKFKRIGKRFLKETARNDIDKICLVSVVDDFDVNDIIEDESQHNLLKFNFRLNNWVLYDGKEFDINQLSLSDDDVVLVLY